MIRRNEGLSHANAKGEAASPPRGKNNRLGARRSPEWRRGPAATLAAAKGRLIRRDGRCR